MYRGPALLEFQVGRPIWTLLPWPLRSEVAVEKSALALSTLPLPQLRAKGSRCLDPCGRRQIHPNKTKAKALSLMERQNCVSGWLVKVRFRRILRLGTLHLQLFKNESVKINRTAVQCFWIMLCNSLP